MVTTRVRWNESFFDQTQDNSQVIEALELKLQELLGEQWLNNQHQMVDNDQGGQDAVRTWPDQAMAEAWIAFVNSLDSPPDSAIIATD